MKTRRMITTLTFLMFMFMATGTVLADLSDGLVAYYPFNGNADDESVNGNDGTVNGATLTSDRFGNVDSAYSFDGINNIILVNDDPSIEPSTELTISAWVRSSGNWGDHNIINKDAKIGSVSNGYLLRAGEPENVLNVFAGGNGTEFSAPTDMWVHVVGVYVASTRIALFIDGEQKVLKTSGISSSITYGTGKLAIGGPFDSIGSFFNGDVDDVRIYNRALSDSEIQELFNMSDVVNVSVDIKPRRWPNVLHINKCGKKWDKRKKLRVAILGTENFDVNTIDIDSIRLNGVKHKRHRIKDVAAPSVLELCDGEVTVPDTWTDLGLMFIKKDIIKSIVEAQEVHDGDTIKLPVTGNLTDGTTIVGADCVLIRVEDCDDDDSSGSDDGNSDDKKWKKKHRDDDDSSDDKKWKKKHHGDDDSSD